MKLFDRHHKKRNFSNNKTQKVQKVPCVRTNGHGERHVGAVDDVLDLPAQLPEDLQAGQVPAARHHAGQGQRREADAHLDAVPRALVQLERQLQLGLIISETVWNINK